MLKTLLGLGPKVDIPKLLAEGAIVVDVRTKGEYVSGHAKGSINIPLDQLEKELHRLKREKTVITCCASGMRSSSAASILRNHGFQAHNGGPWSRVQAALNAK